VASSSPAKTVGAQTPTEVVIRLREMENEMVKRLMWSGVLAACGALASIASQRLAAMVWRRMFGEEPPE
jgi:hypothetical protein